jgi:iron complex outermembrane receptor protein
METKMTPRRIVTRCGASLALLLLTALGGWAADDRAVVTGIVTTPDGVAVTDARVAVVELNRATFTDETGAYRIEDVPFGDLHLKIVSRRFGSGVEEITVDRAEVRIDVRVGLSSHEEAIVVTASPGARGAGEAVQPVTVLDDYKLNQRMKPTIGDTLAQEPGLSQSYFGGGASRPIIRGQGGGRIRVLEGGIGVGDASTTSPDHAVATDPMAASRVEIVRGPSTLFYGGQAVGGVVNILDERIPEYAPQERFSGEVHLRVGSVADERRGAAKLGGGAGQFAWHVDAMKLESDDYDIPGNAVVDDPDSPSGTLPNSAIETESGALGTSWVGRNGFVGISYRRFDTLYGIPAGHEHEEDTGVAPQVQQGHGGIDVDMKQRRYDLRGGFDSEFGPFTGLRFAAGFNDYEHAELEGDEIGTRFLVDHTEARVELSHGESRPFSGGFGLQYKSRDLEALGEEAFIPPSTEDSGALFALERLTHKAFRYEFGLRVERVRADTRATVAADPMCDDPRARNFTPVSGSFGFAWLPGDNVVGISITRGARAPSAEELYSCGEHSATRSFEVGDPNLGEETGFGVDLSYRRREGKVTGEVNLFANRYDDFIFERRVATPPNELPVFAFTQADSLFTGLELGMLIELYHRDAHDLDFEIVGDYVKAELRDSGEPLPFIPPLSLGFNVLYQGLRWYASAGVRKYDDQDRVPDFQTPTAGYTMVNANVGYRIVAGALLHDVSVRGINLANEDARLATSRLKDEVPLPGRDVSLIYRLVF